MISTQTMDDGMQPAVTAASNNSNFVGWSSGVVVVVVSSIFSFILLFESPASYVEGYKQTFYYTYPPAYTQAENPMRDYRAR